jgi:hypothetical protein
MNITLPKTISGWCMWLFFLLTGIGAFVPAVAGFAVYLALAYAILAFLGL